jgi:serine phosphatase RsbU (regulator of sigma subunit)
MYLFSDGFADQNNTDRVSFSNKNLLNVFQQIAILPCTEQKEILENTLNKFMEAADQRDDITIIGVKF